MLKLTLGERLKVARKEHGLTQDELAEKIGTSRGVITNIEHNKIETPQPVVVNAICDILNINNDWLLHGKGNMNKTTEAAKSAKLIAEICNTAQELSEDELLYILDVINSYKRHMTNLQKNT